MNVLKSVYGNLLLMKEDISANILTRDEDEGDLIGEAWEEDDLLDLYLEEEPWAGRVRVDIENLDDYKPQYIETHYRIDKNGARYLSTTSEQRAAKLPQNNSELEAYVVAALRKYRNE